MPPTDNLFSFLLFYLRRHWSSYTMGVFAIASTNWIAVSLPLYIQLSIDLIREDTQGGQKQLNEYLLIMVILVFSMM